MSTCTVPVDEVVQLDHVGVGSWSFEDQLELDGVVEWSHKMTRLRSNITIQTWHKRSGITAIGMDSVWVDPLASLRSMVSLLLTAPKLVLD